MYDDYIKFSNETHINHFDNVELKNIDINYSFCNSEQGREVDSVYEFSFSNIMTMVYLYLTDRLGMGNSMEIRSPLLDYKLVEFISSLPILMKYKEGQPKYFMKHTLKGIIPDYILFAEKRGFTPPNTFVQNLVDNYNYEFFKANHKFYNSILADRVLSLNLLK